MSIFAKKKETHVDNGQEYNKYTVLSDSQDDSKELAERSDITAINESIESINTDIENINDGIDSINANLTSVNSRLFVHRTVNSSNPLDIPTGLYASGIIMGMAQNVGYVLIGFGRSESSLTVRNLLNNSAWSNAALTVSISGNNIRVASTESANSKFTVIFDTYQD